MSMTDHYGPSDEWEGIATIRAAAARGVMLTILGTKRLQYLEENIGALDVRLTADELAELNLILPSGITAGALDGQSQLQNLNL